LDFRLVEPLSFDKYKINGKQVGSFLITTKIPYPDSRTVVGLIAGLVNNNKGYVFMYFADPHFFDREKQNMEHMINSIKLYENT